MVQELVRKEETIPGIGMSGLVMCPLLKSPCLKHGCEFWVELNYDGQKVGRCTLSWLSILATETRQSLDKLSQEQSKNNIEESK